MIEYFTEIFSTPRGAVAQIFGFMAMAGAIICFVQKDRKKIMTWQVIVCCLWTLHFVILGSPTGAAINGMQIVRSLIFLVKDKYKWASWNGWPVVFVFITVGLSLLTWEGWLSILPVIGTIFSTVSLWMKRPIVIRLLTLPVSFTWGTFDYLSNSIAGVCNETFVVISIIFAIFTIDLKQIKKEKAEKTA